MLNEQHRLQGISVCLVLYNKDCVIMLQQEKMDETCDCCGENVSQNELEAHKVSGII